jgi:hypothetical protein
MNINIKSPKKITWIVALVLAVITFISLLFTIPVLTDLSPWIALVGLVLLLVASVVDGL